MKFALVKSLRQRLDALFWGEDEPRGLKRPVITVGRLLYLVARKANRDLVLERAASLAFASSLSLIPLGVIVILIFHGLFDFEDRLIEFREYIVSLVAEDSREQVSRWLIEIEGGLRAPLANSSAITPIAVAGLLIAGMTLYRSTERNFSAVWEVPVTRSFFQRLATFWLLLTAVPFVLGLSIVPDLREVTAIGDDTVQISWVQTIALPGLISFLGFSVLFTVMPNARVKIHAAALGAIVAAVIWGVGTHAFAFYVRNLANQSVYGALGVLPFGLLYLYYSWAVALGGAEISYCAQQYRLLVREMRLLVGSPRLSPGGAGIALMGRVFGSLGKPGPGPSVSAVAELIRYPIEDLMPIVRKLEAAGFVTVDERHRLNPTIAAGLLTPAEVVGALDVPRFAPDTDTVLAGFLADVDREIGERLSEKTFEDLSAE